MAMYAAIDDNNYSAEPVITISKLKESTPLTEEATLNVRMIPLTSPEAIVLPS